MLGLGSNPDGVVPLIFLKFLKSIVSVGGELTSNQIQKKQMCFVCIQKGFV
jgi:hypothetical protein